MFFLLVNLVREHGLQGIATMGNRPRYSEWSANKAIDGNTAQSFLSHSCAITDYNLNITSVWWKVWLKKQFNIAYLEIYFRSDSKLTSSSIDH